MKSNKAITQLTYLLFLCSFLKAVVPDKQMYTISDFTGGYFKIVSKEPGIYNLDVGFNGAMGHDEKPMAFGDLNNDGKTDIVTVSADNQTIRVYSYDSETERFVKSNTINSPHFKNAKILSLILTDMSNDKNVDIQATVVPNSTPNKANIYTFTKTGETFILDNNFTIPNIRKQQPFVFTLYNALTDSSTNATYATYLLLDNEDAQRQIWYVDTNANDGPKIVQKNFSTMLNTKNPVCMEQGNVTNYFMDSTLGSSFIDMNADCRPDLLQNTVGNGATKKQEYYLWTDDGFCLIKIQDVDSNATMPTFVDLNNRGTNDMIMLEQNTGSSPIKVNVFKNIHTTDLSDHLCKQNAENLDFPYPAFLGDLKKSSDNFITYNLENPNWYLYEDESDPDTPPLQMLGDQDLDGIADMSLVMSTGTKGNKNSAQVVPFRGQKCTPEAQKLIYPDGNHNKLEAANCRYFNHTAFQDLEKNKGSQYETSNTLRTAFFDFGEQGALSMISTQWDSEKKETKISTYLNFLNNNNYFLKSMARTHGKEYGNTFIGQNYLAVRTEMDGTKDPVSMPQQFGMSHTRLQLPYAQFGLGRINNYIEDFTAGVTRGHQYFDSWSPIIPNSQLIITPPLGSNKWKIEIYINPTKAMAQIIISTLIVLFIIGVVIIIFHIKEKEQDRKANENLYFMPL